MTLKGNQKKLDVNKNNKIDKNDFKYYKIKKIKRKIKRNHERRTSLFTKW